MSSKLKKINKIFLLLILFIQISSYLEEEENNIELGDNNRYIFNSSEGKDQKLYFTEKNESFYIAILSLEKAKINLDNNNTSSEIEKELANDNQLLLINIKEQVITSENQIGNLTFNVNGNTEIEVTSVRKNPNTEYKKIDYQLDQELKVKNNNNFVIFLDDEDVEKFDMKFSFKDDIKNEEICYGFIRLPFNKKEYIPLGKKYDGTLKCEKFDDNSKQLSIDNPYYKKNKDNLRPYTAFIFSINKEDKLIQEFSFTINSEIINVFLIVSIVIALIFAVITFFLIRRKQSSESGTIEGDDNSYNKKDDKEDKDDKEEATEN